MSTQDPPPSSLYAVCADVSFVCLPLIVLTLVKLWQGAPTDILSLSDWSFGSIVLFGQSIVKFAAGMASTERRARWQFVAFILSLLIVFGLMPSITLLVLGQAAPRCGLWTIAAPVLFVVAVSTYFLVGRYGQELLDKNSSA